MLDNNGPDNELFASQGETSTAGLNTGSTETTSTGLGTDDRLGSTLGSASALGSDEQAGSSRGATTGNSTALGSDPSEAGLIQGNVVGNQTLLMENDNATSNSNVGASADDTQGM